MTFLKVLVAMGWGQCFLFGLGCLASVAAFSLAVQEIFKIPVVLAVVSGVLFLGWTLYSAYVCSGSSKEK